MTSSGPNLGLGGPGALRLWGAPTPGYNKIFAFATFDIAVRCSIMEGGLELVVAKFHFKKRGRAREGSGVIPPHNYSFRNGT